jgi:hypothetical protein
MAFLGGVYEELRTGNAHTLLSDTNPGIPCRSLDDQCCSFSKKHMLLQILGGLSLGAITN